MFNFKKHVSAADLSSRLSPEEIPGRTIQEKAAYISEYLDREIGEKLASGEINTKAMDLGQDDFMFWRRGVSL